MKVKSLCFEYEANGEIEIRVDNVPKLVMKTIATKFEAKPDFEGVTEFIKISLHGVTIKLCRITNSKDLIEVNTP